VSERGARKPKDLASIVELGTGDEQNDACASCGGRTGISAAAKVDSRGRTTRDL